MKRACFDILGPMRIGVDAGCLGISDNRLKTGVYNLSHNVLRELIGLDKTNSYDLYSFYPISKNVLAEYGDRMVNKVLLPKRFWLSGRLSLEMAINPPDVFLGFGQALPFFCRKSILFVYDLAFLRYPELYGRRGLKLNQQTRSGVRRTDKIVAISESTARDLAGLLDIKKEKIVVIYPGVDENFKLQPKSTIDSLRKSYNLRCPYFLFVGSLKPIKNISRLIEAFSLFSKKTKADLDLILAGSDFWINQKITKAIAANRRVKNLGYVSDNDLSALYSGAEALVSPALYEGFGFPLVEAMACGTPVITSDVGSMPEVVGRAGILVNPLDVEAIEGAMEKLWRNKGLRRQLSLTGLERAKRYSWKGFAKSVLGIIEEVSKK